MIVPVGTSTTQMTLSLVKEQPIVSLAALYSETERQERSFKNHTGILDEIGGRKYDHKCFVKEITSREGERGAIVHITDYNMNIFIPLRKENVSYEVYGVQTAIETYFWDFYGAGLRMLSAEAWAMATEFIRAQNNVLSEFRQEGLL